MSDERARWSIYLIANPAAEALDFYVKGFGAEEVERWIDPENGKIGHAEIRIGGAALYVADGYATMERIGVKSPRALGGTTVNMWLKVDDLEVALERAVNAGAKITVPVEDNPNEGGRRVRISDPAGHAWTLKEK